MSSVFDKIKISEYDYELPEFRIAKHPLDKRDEAKLLLYRDGCISDDVFRNIENYIPEGSTLVLNNTKVVRARLNFTKSTGAPIEVFLLEPTTPVDYAQSFGSCSAVCWKCLVGNLKRWKDEVLELAIPQSASTLHARKRRRLAEGVEVEFAWDNADFSFARVVELCGNVPIPPYLNRRPEEADKERYQTVYAQPEGSVAAPTAGLHFTPAILDRLSAKSVEKQYVTLHVGAGTFKPVKAENIAQHEMHTEHFFVNRQLVERVAHTEGKLFAVGTTALRTLESLYWLGVKAHRGQLQPPLFISQWEAYTLPQMPVKTSFNALLGYLDGSNASTVAASTQVMIVPGYTVMTADALVTNFHQPRSTLLLLISALIGDDWRKVYWHAMENGYRFLSYGDSSLLFRRAGV